MKPNKIDHSIVFENYIEARVASDIFVKLGRNDLAESIEPSVPAERLGLIEFITLYSPYRRKNQEFTTPAELSSDILIALGSLAIPSDVFTQKISPEHAAGKMLNDFIPQVSEDAPYSIKIVPKL